MKLWSDAFGLTKTYIESLEDLLPDAFAAVFVQRVYDRVLEGETFGRALLAARRYFWERHHNPLGLLYAAYTRLETRIVAGGEPGQRA